MKSQAVELTSIQKTCPLKAVMTADIEKEPQPSTDDSSGKKEDIFDLVGGNGLWQKCIFLVIMFFCIPSATHTLAMSFLAPNLDHWCARPEGSNWTVEEWKELALPADDMKCSRYKYVNRTFPLEENATVTTSDETISCDAWEYDTSFYSSTVLSQWDLVCDRKWLVSLSNSVFMAGIFASSLLFGQLADSLGRKPAITATCAIAMFSAIICAFSTSFMMFIVTRFFLALGLAGIYNIAFVLLMEVIGPDQRSIYGVAINFGWGIGFISLPGVAYVLRDWFWIQIVLTAPCLVLLFTWWLLPESPRWLMSKGRVEEAQKTLLKAAKTNGKDLSDVETKLKKLMAKATEVHESGETSGNYLDLILTPGLWQMTLNVYLLWFVNSFVYYGLSYNTNELAGNAFINFALCGAVEFPAYFFTMFAIRSLGRRNPLAGAMIIGGVACLLMYFAPEEPLWIGVSISMIGKFCISCSFCIIYVFTAELFPTMVRNIGLGSSSVFARIGSILAPFVRELGYATHPILPQVVFGILAFVSGLLVFLLPETNKISIPETLADAASRKKPSRIREENGGHVVVKLSNVDGEENDMLEDTPTITVPSPKPLQNGKKLDDVPEEDGHSEIVDVTQDDKGDDQQEELEQPKDTEIDQLPVTADVPVEIDNPESTENVSVNNESDQKTNL